jgi:hypothetical protein
MPRYTLPLDEQTYERVKAEAAAEDRSIGNMLRWLIAEALAARDDRRAEAGR